MRNPLPVLAAAMLAAAGAFAGDLPTWTPVAEPYTAWRYVEFTDAAGTYHVLHCRWSECGSKVTKGTAPLYVLEKAGEQAYTASEPYRAQYASTYAGKTWEWLKAQATTTQFQSTKTTYKSQVSRFVLDMSAQPNKAVIKGTDVAIPVDPEHTAVSPTGWLWVVLSPVSVADDAPKAPAKNDDPKPGRRHRHRHQPETEPRTEPTPSAAPGARAQVELSVLERHWMTPAERKAYDASVDDSKKPAAAALQASYKKGRETVAANLRDTLQKPYKDLVDAGTFDKIDELLTNQEYRGSEIALRPEEYEALKKVLKTADAHADFKAANAAAEYDLEMPPADARLAEFVWAHQITEKFRKMVPPPPGQQADPSAPLTEADWAKITVPADRDALKKQYDADFAKADTPDAKAAVNKDYRARIDDWVAKHQPATAPTPFDPAAIKTWADFDALSNDQKNRFCDMTTGDGAAASCNEIMDATSDAMTQCVGKKGLGANPSATDVAKAKSDCLGTIHPECKASPNAAVTRPPLANLDPKISAWCANRTSPTSTGTNGGGTGSATAAVPSPTSSSSDCGGKKGKDAAGASTDKKDPTTTAGSDTNPCPKAGDDDKKTDANFYNNVGTGLSFGIGGMLLGSFFGGPALILAVGLACGIGGYFFARANDEPHKDKK